MATTMGSDTISVKSNQLGLEKSPYLLQHKDNPVWWYAWGEEAFTAAKRENKPIFLSIGYSTCYWCHVMEKDSFEYDDVAEILNRDFIAIKIDREERPDIDALYMEAVTALSGHGGWPMSVFLTPDLKPFWGGTFFYREQFKGVLRKIAEVWRLEEYRIVESSRELTSLLARGISGESQGSLPEIVDRVTKEFIAEFDVKYGGFGKAPKFPPSLQISLLLREYYRSDDGTALTMATVTLERMSSGGIFDHLGGGFHRYSVDEKWLVPHFEKMLYDNALLATTYLEAFQVTANDTFRTTAGATLDYLLDRMESPLGGFYSAEDAGEVGREGEFYVWKYQEIEELLTPEEFQTIVLLYGLTKKGNFEDDTTILTLTETSGGQGVQTTPVQNALRKLFVEREKRVRPHLDDKILTAWNGLAITALAKGYQVTLNQRYLSAAQKCATFMMKNLCGADGLLRRYRDGEAKFSAYAEDYAFLIEGLLTLYESDFNEQWLGYAFDLQQEQNEKLWDEKEGGYFFSSAPEVVVRRKEYIDNAVPSANSVSALNLLRLYGFFTERRFKEMAEEIFQNALPLMERYPSAFSKLLHGAHYYLGNPKEITISGVERGEVEKAVRHLHFNFNPHKVIAKYESNGTLPPMNNGKESRDPVAIFVCEEGRCALPVSSVEDLEELLTSNIQLRCRYRR